jgi:hypothetical protein
MPAAPLFDDEEHGRVKLGGCLVDVNNPDRYCTVCRHEWCRNPLPDTESPT